MRWPDVDAAFRPSSLRRRAAGEHGGGDIVLIIKTVALLVVLLSIIGVFFLGGMIVVDRVIMPAYTHLGSEVELPDIVEKEYYQARQDLTAIGLEIEITSEDYHSIIPENNIIEQTPAAFSKVKKGRTVGVVVSRGPEKFIVPNVVRMNVDQARDRLREEGLLVGNTTSQIDPASAGMVIAQSPAAGSNVVRTQVDLTVSAGPGQVTVIVPRFVDQFSIFEAIKKVAELRGKVSVEWVTDDNSLMHTVVEQSPAPGTRVEGTPVFHLKASLRSGARPPALPDTVGISVPPPEPPPAGEGLRPRISGFPPPLR